MRWISLAGTREPEERSSAWWAALAGGVAGAGASSLLDRRRRAELQQRAGRLVREMSGGGHVLTEDLRNRTLGFLSELSGVARGRAVDDDILTSRVRERLGRVCSHPSAVEAAACNGEVVLRGPVLESEAASLLRGVSHVRGVKRVIDRLERHDEESARRIPSLQGGRRRGARFELAQQYWSPSARLLAGLAGIGLVGWAVRWRGLMGMGAAVVGGSLLARGLTNLEVKRLFGIGAGRRAINLDKTIYIDAPREEVFAFFSAFENFPRFMSHIKEVRPLGGNRSRWTAEAVAGMDFSWDAEITREVPNEVLAWKSIGRPAVENAGFVRFTPEGAGTRLAVRLAYNPPAGAIGHAFARLLGSDPKKLMDDDLLRLKSLIEKGKARGRFGQVAKDEVRPLH